MSNERLADGTCAMPHYYFNVCDGIAYEDHQGEDLADLEAARTYAGNMARDLRKGRNPAPHGDWSEWKIVVSDDSGDNVFEFPFSDAAM